jgi:hypothetical protein
VKEGVIKKRMIITIHPDSSSTPLDLIVWVMMGQKVLEHCSFGKSRGLRMKIHRVS